MKNQVIVWVSMILILTGCSKDNDTGKEELGKIAIRVSGSIVTTPESRASNTSWDSNDTIGIFMLKTNSNEVAYDVTNRSYYTMGIDNSFGPTTIDQTIYYPANNSLVDFVAYYPYALYNYDIIDVSDQSNQRAIDFMATEREVDKDKNNPTINFRFKHRLTKLEFNIRPGEGVTASQLAGLQIELTNQKDTAWYSLPENSLTPRGLDATIRMKATADGHSAEGIILPAGATPDRELVFTFTDTDLNFRHAIPNEVFKAGEKHIYTVTLNNHNSMVITGRIIPCTKEDDDVNGIVVRE